MASSDRTPGPWHLQPMGNGYRVLGGPPRHRIVAYVGARRLADAHLIVAAPELLAMCERAYERGGLIEPGSWAELKALIAKAKGEETE